MQLFQVAVVLLASIAGSLAQDDNPFGCKRNPAGICTLEYAPICSSDGVTSGNRCGFCAHYFAQKDNGIEITINHNGVCTLDDACSPMSKKGFCPRMYSPVCDQYGKTYNSECERCADLYAEADGKNVDFVPATPGRCEDHSVKKRAAEFCKPRFFTGACTREYNPVCGSDGNTYGNPCTFCYSQHVKEQNGEVLEFTNFGKCETVVEDEPSIDCSIFDARPNICTLEYNPVCGSDGVTYGNPCDFCNARRGKNVRLDHFGQCETAMEDEPSIDCSIFDARPNICTMEYNPVCGSDGVTYGNPCEFCNARRTKNVRFNHFGECKAVKKSSVDCSVFGQRPKICTLEYNPVCGSDGQSYPNPCTFCSLRTADDVTVDHFGRCETTMEDEPSIDCSIFDARPNICTLEYNPVCGSDGHTYGNPCGFCHARRQKNVRLDHFGQC